MIEGIRGKVFGSAETIRQEKSLAVESWENNQKRNPCHQPIIRGRDGLPVEFSIKGFQLDTAVFKVNGEEIKFWFDNQDDSIQDIFDIAVNRLHLAEKFRNDYSDIILRTEILHYGKLGFFNVLVGSHKSS